MADVCGSIIAEILNNCDAIVPGIKDTAYFVNIDDVDKDNCTFDPDNSVLLTQLVLLANKTAYRIQGKNLSHEHKTSMVKKTYQKSWEHGFIFKIFENDPATKKWIQNAKDSRFIVIQENSYNKQSSPAGTTVFEVLGWDNGLEINAAERDANSDETMGGWLVTAGCHEKMKESKPPLAYFVGSVALTRAAIAAMLA